MAVRLVREYNHSTDQLLAAIKHAMATTVKGRRYGPTGPYTLEGTKGMSLLSYGEELRISITGTGIVEVSSQYSMRYPFYEQGENHRNTERLLRALEAYLANEPACCPQCAYRLEQGLRHCTQCGCKLFELADRPPLPQRALRVTLLSCLVQLLIIAFVISLPFLAFLFLGD